LDIALRARLLRVDKLEARMTAVLHDVVEDTSVTLEQLRTESFPASVTEAVAALTKRDDQDYEAFIGRVGPSPLARQAKLADLHDHSDLSRIAQPTQKGRQRDEKYQRAIQRLESRG
jgi:hypothetical protein